MFTDEVFLGRPQQAPVWARARLAHFQSRRDSLSVSFSKASAGAKASILSFARRDFFFASHQRRAGRAVSSARDELLGRPLEARTSKGQGRAGMFPSRRDFNFKGSPGALARAGAGLAYFHSGGTSIL